MAASLVVLAAGALAFSLGAASGRGPLPAEFWVPHVSRGGGPFGLVRQDFDAARTAPGGEPVAAQATVFSTPPQAALVVRRAPASTGLLRRLGLLGIVERPGPERCARLEARTTIDVAGTLWTQYVFADRR